MCAPPKVHDPAKIRKNREFSHTTVKLREERSVAGRTFFSLEKFRGATQLGKLARWLRKLHPSLKTSDFLHLHQLSISGPSLCDYLMAAMAPPPAEVEEIPRLPMPSRNPLPLSAAQEAQVREMYHSRVRSYCAAEIKRLYSPL